MSPIINLGFISIHWYSIMLFLAILFGSNVAIDEAKKHGFSEDFMVNMLFLAIVLGIVGARVYYVIFNFDYYLTNPLEIFEIWNGGLAIHGGILAGLLFTIYYCKKHEMNLWKILDIIVVGLIIAQAIGRWGNFFNSEAYGPITTAAKLKSLGIPTFIINGMYILGEYRQPTFFYESVWCIFGFFAMLLIRKYKYLKVGQLTSFYLIWYGIIRFIIEAMRTDSLMLGPIKVAQLVSIIFIVSGIVILIKRPQKGQKELYNMKLGGQNV